MRIALSKEDIFSLYPIKKYQMVEPVGLRQGANFKISIPIIG